MEPPPVRLPRRLGRTLNLPAINNNNDDDAPHIVSNRAFTISAGSSNNWHQQRPDMQLSSDGFQVSQQFARLNEIPATKHVYKLLCKHCKAIVCVRGMKAFLLADSSVELYSTDRPYSNICVIGDDYMMRTCHCRVQDVACLECGNVIGYHIVAPCTLCLGSSNNGHLWMFCAEQCEPVERYDTNQKAMRWPNIPKVDLDFEFKIERFISYHHLCR